MGKAAERWKQSKGAFFLSCVVLIWVLSAVLIRSIFHDPSTSFSKPLFLTYYNTGFFVFYLVPLIVEYLRVRSDREQLRALKAETKEIMKLSFVFCFLWFSSNYFYNLGLVSTSVSSSSILSNTSAIFVFLIEVTFLWDPSAFHWLKPVWVFICFAGITMITVVDSSGPSGSKNHSFLGDMFSLVGAASYGLYAIFLRIKVPKEKEETFKFTHFLGFVGLFNLVLLLPLFPIFDALGIEKFEWPNSRAFLLLSVNGFIGTFVSDYCWARSVVLLGPLITTMGLCLNTPISLGMTAAYEKVKFSWWYLFGSFLAFSSFLGLSYTDYKLYTKRQLGRKEAEADYERVPT